MALDIKPGTWLGPGYAYTATGTNGPIYFGTSNQSLSPNKTLPNLTNAEMHATTGDVRKVLFALAEDIYQKIKSPPNATVDPLVKVAVTRSNSVDSTTGNFIFTYVYTFQLGAAGFEVANET